MHRNSVLVSIRNDSSYGIPKYSKSVKYIMSMSIFLVHLSSISLVAAIYFGSATK